MVVYCQLFFAVIASLAYTWLTYKHYGVLGLVLDLIVLVLSFMFLVKMTRNSRLKSLRYQLEELFQLNYISALAYMTFTILLIKFTFLVFNIVIMIYWGGYLSICYLENRQKH